MNKQNFVLNELEAIGKDIQGIVQKEREEIAQEEQGRKEQEERRKKGEAIGRLARPYDPNGLIPELAYLEVRLHAVKNYLNPESVL